MKDTEKIYLKYISKISDFVVTLISAMAVMPIVFGIILGYSYVTVFFAKEGAYIPWFIDLIFVWSSLVMYVLLALFFVSIGRSVWDEIKKSIANNILKI